MKNMGNDQLITRNSEFFSTNIEDHLVLFCKEKAEYYDLDPIAANIWDRLSTPQTMSGLLDHLVATYEGDRATIEADMKLFLGTMQARDMIRIDVL
jgi:hypothetical protein